MATLYCLNTLRLTEKQKIPVTSILSLIVYKQESNAPYLGPEVRTLTITQPWRSLSN